MKIVSYGYFAKGSGQLTLCDERFASLAHVFPLFAVEGTLRGHLAEQINIQANNLSKVSYEAPR